MTSSHASIKARPSDNLMDEDKRQKLLKNKKGNKVVRSFGNNIDEDDIAEET